MAHLAGYWKKEANCMRGISVRSIPNMPLDSYQWHTTKVALVAYGMAILISALLGGIIALGKPLLLLLVVGSFLAVALVSKPELLLWATTGTTLVVAGIFKLFLPALDKVWWIGYGMAALLFIPAIQAVLSNKNSIDTHTPLKSGLLGPGIAFLSVIIASTVINKSPVWQIILASKSAFFYAGLWAALALYPFSANTIKRWLLGLLAIGLLQIFPVLYQYLFTRADRIERGVGTIEASDAVVGTFGGNLDAGGLTAALAFFLVVAIGVVISFYRQKLISPRLTTFLCFGLGTPLLLMEVKIIFLYIPIMLMLLFRDLLTRQPGRYFGMMFGVFFLMSSGILAYQTFHWSARGGSLAENVAESFSYSFDDTPGQQKLYTGEMTRKEVLVFWWNKHDIDRPFSFLFGHGMGASRAQGMGLGAVARYYYPLHIDRSSLAMLLWDFGLVGAASFVWIFIAASMHALRLYRDSHAEAWEASLASALFAIFPLFLFMLPYRSDIPYAAPMMFMLFAALGILGWLDKTIRSRRYV